MPGSYTGHDRHRDFFSAETKIMNKVALFETLNAFAEGEDGNDEGAPPKIDLDEMWTTLLDVSKNEPHGLSGLLPLLVQLRLSIPTWDKPGRVLEEAVEKLEKEIEIDSLKQLLNLLPVLPLSISGKVFACFVKKIEGGCDVPQINQIIANLDVEAVSEDALGCISDLFTEQRTPASAMAIAPFIEVLASDDESTIVQTCSAFILEKLKGTVEEQISALFLFEHLAPVYASGEESVPKDVFGLVAPILFVPDETLSFRAHKATRRMIDSGLWNEELHIVAILSQYREYGEEHLGLFYKLIGAFLEEMKTPKMKVLQEIFDFACGAIKNEKSAVSRAKSLECLSRISSFGKTLIEDVYEEGLDVAEALLKAEEKKCYTEIANYMLAMTMVYPETTLPRVKASLPVLVRSLADEEAGTKKQRLERAESLASIGQGCMSDELLAMIADFTLQALTNVAGGELFYICSVVLALKDVLKPEVAKELFVKLENLARTEVVSTRLNALLHTMKKILKRFDVDASQFANDIIDGNIAILSKLPLFSCHDEKTMLFYFISAYIRKFPLKSGDITGKLIACVPRVVFGMLPVVLEPVEAALHAGIVSFEDAKKLYNTITELLEGLGVSGDEATCACFDILSKIGKTNPELIDVPKILEIIKNHVTGGEDDDDDKTETPEFPVIVRFVLEIYTSKTMKADVDPELLKIIIGALPLHPDISAMEEIMMLLVKLLDDLERFKPVVVPVMIAISELLMLKKSDLDEYEFSPEALQTLRETLKKMLQADKTLERQITKSFNSRPKLNRFSAMLKQINSK